PVGDLKKFPVLVLTHKAYEIGMDKVNQGQENSSNWGAYNRWNDGHRRLVAIDEALDIIKLHQVTLETVKQVLAAIPEELALKYPEPIQAIRTMESILREMATVAKAREQLARGSGQDVKEHERVLWRGAERLPDPARMTELRRELGKVSFDRG